MRRCCGSTQLLLLHHVGEQFDWLKAHFNEIKSAHTEASNVNSTNRFEWTTEQDKRTRRNERRHRTEARGKNIDRVASRDKNSRWQWVAKARDDKETANRRKKCLRLTSFFHRRHHNSNDWRGTHNITHTRTVPLWFTFIQKSICFWLAFAFDKDLTMNDE